MPFIPYLHDLKQRRMIDSPSQPFRMAISDAAFFPRNHQVLRVALRRLKAHPLGCSGAGTASRGFLAADCL